MDLVHKQTLLIIDLAAMRPFADANHLWIANSTILQSRLPFEKSCFSFRPIVRLANWAISNFADCDESKLSAPLLNWKTRIDVIWNLGRCEFVPSYGNYQTAIFGYFTELRLQNERTYIRMGIREHICPVDQLRYYFGTKTSTAGWNLGGKVTKTLWFSLINW